MTIGLRPYQREALSAIADLLAEKKDAQAIVACPTGTGKTALGLALATSYGRTLWIAHTDELIQQPEEELRALYPHHDVGVVKARRDNWGAKDVVLACVDTICKERRLARLVETQRYSEVGGFKLIVVDEAHHCREGNSYHTVLDAFDGCPRIGLTATPERADGKPLGNVFRDGIVYRFTVQAAIAGKWLVPPLPRRVTLPQFDPAQIATNAAGDFDQGELERALLESHAAEATATATAEAVRDGRKCLVFTLSVRQARETCEALRKLGVSAEWLSGETKEDERRRLLAAHKRGDFSVLLNCCVLIEGYNDPTIDCVVVARPTRSRPFYIQQVGRGLRTDPARPIDAEGGKKDCLIIDLVGAHGAHGLQTADDILATEDEEEEAEAGRARAIRATSDEDELLARLGADEEAKRRLRAFLAYVSGEREIEGVTVESNVRWLVAEPRSAYVLSAGEHGMVVVERVDGERFQAVLEARDQATQPLLLTLEPASLEIAQTVGENYVRLAGALRLSARDSQWRGRRASEAQVRALDRWHVHAPPDVTAGQASDLMTMAVARARWKARKKRPPAPRVERAGAAMFWRDL